MPLIQGPESFMTTDEIIGIGVIVIGVIICIIRLLYKKRKEREDLDNQLELPPKKTAADHLEGLKGAMQRVVHSLRIHTQREPQSILDNSILFPGEERKLSSNDNATRSSKSFNRKVESRLGSHELSRDNSKYGSSVGSLRIDSLTVKPQNKFLQAPPPSPSKFHDDIIEVEPIKMSLPSNISKYTHTLSSPSKTSSPVPPKSQSLIESRIQSRMGSRMPSLEINPSIYSQSTSSSSSQS